MRGDIALLLSDLFNLSSVNVSNSTLLHGGSRVGAASAPEFLRLEYWLQGRRF